MSLTIGGVVVLLIAAVALSSRSVAVTAFILAIPFKELAVLTAIGRTFRPIEVMAIVLGIHMLARVWSMSWDDRRAIATSPLFLSIGAFAALCVVSTAYAYVVPPTGVTVHPYNTHASFGAFEFSTFEFGRNNITQLLMRLFFLGAILSVAMTFDRDDVIRGIRWLVYAAIVSGAIGLVYQIAIITGQLSIPQLFHTIGFMRFSLEPQLVGPIPRMYSIQGEPGTVANLLLVALSMVSVSILATARPIFSQWRDLGVGIVLVILIILTTGTTGYGGMMILAAVLTVTVVFHDRLSAARLLRLSAAGGALVVTGVVAIALVGVDLSPLIEYPLSKIQFQGGSGSTRLRYLLLEIDALEERPILGLGIGSHQSTSVFGTIATDTGLLGFAVFCIMHALIFGECLTHGRSIRGYPIPAMLFVAGITLFLTNLLARDASSLLFGWYWLSVGFPLALHRERVLSIARGGLYRITAQTTTSTP